MGLSWTKFSESRLNYVQDQVLSRVQDHVNREGSNVVFERKYTQVGDHTIHSIECAREDGSNEEEPILMLHGYGAGSLLFANNLAGLAQKTGRKVIAVDWIGCGSSSRPKFTPENADETIDFFLKPFDKFLEERKIQKFDAIAHSLGAYLMSNYILTEQGKDKVKNLVLASPAGVPKPQPLPDNLPFIFKVILSLWNSGATPNHLVRGAGPWGKGLVEKVVRARFGGDVTLGIKGISNENEETRNYLIEYLYHITVAQSSGEHALSKIFLPGAMARKPLCYQLPQAEKDILFVYGTRDWMDSSAADQVVPQMKNSKRKQVVTIPGTHHVYLNYSDMFDQIVYDFIGGKTHFNVFQNVEFA